MAQSRVQKGKGKRSKFPMWGIGIIVVLVVVIAGYAIVRFSKASGVTAEKTPGNGLFGGVQTVSKKDGTKTLEVGTKTVYADFTYNEISAGDWACVKVWGNKGAQYKVLLIEAQNNLPGLMPIQPHTAGSIIFNQGWGELCYPVAEIRSKLAATRGKARLYTAESYPDKDVILVSEMYITTTGNYLP